MDVQWDKECGRGVLNGKKVFLLMDTPLEAPGVLQGVLDSLGVDLNTFTRQYGGSMSPFHVLWDRVFYMT